MTDARAADAPPMSPEEVLAFLASRGIEATTTRHEAAFTVEQSKHLTGHIPGAHSKNLFVKDKKGRLFLVVAEHEQRIDLKRLHEVIGGNGRLSFCSPEQMMTYLGVTPGSVTALSVINDRNHDVTVVIDAGLIRSPVINCHPLVNTATTSLARDGLLRFFTATGHEPLIVALPEPPVET
ncbi:MAG: prolyl-tRNA synthetase associated domain-containing protein [Hyphomicrobiales bacterium]|jgi:Ala-tRNA(Pro) deacylase|nr:prolyl-tRNA synthetase associated domain-containing protein [Hyphomicrobiales bacterium]